MTITEIAFAAGFNSATRFNDAFTKTYKTAPRIFRKELPVSPKQDTLQLELPFIKPFDWSYLLSFFSRHATAGVELVDQASYLRQFKTTHGVGYFRASLSPKADALKIEIHVVDLADLRLIIEKIRSMFDLAHNPHRPILKKTKHFDPNTVRIPGSFDTFEAAVWVNW